MDQGTYASKVNNVSAGVTTHVVYSKEQVATFWEVPQEQAKSVVLEHAAHDEEILQVQRKIKKKLSKRDRETLKYTYAELDQLMKEWLNNAEVEQQSYSSDKTLSKRVGRRTVAFLASCHDYLKAYSGVVQLMEGVSSGYGTAAYEVLSIFLVVAVNKKRTEIEIDSMLETLRREYARIGRLEPIYASKDMHGYVAKVYDLGIHFLQDAARYYSFKSYRRFWHILAKPPSIDLQGRVSSIKEAIALLVEERDTQDRIRLGSVETKVEASLELTLSSKAEERLEKLGALLETVDEDLYARLDAYEDRLQETFNLKTLEPFNFERTLLRNEVFQAWDTGTASSFLVIRGKTVAPHNTRLSWVSPAATGVIRQRRVLSPSASPRNPSPGNQDNIGLAFYCCQGPDADLQDPARPLSPTTVFSALIHQLLRTRKARAILNDDENFNKLKLSISRAGTAASRNDRQAWLLKLHAILGSLLKDLSFSKMYLVLDRLDSINNHDIALKLFLDLIETCPTGLKILIVVRYIGDDFLIDSREKGCFRELVFDQH